MWGSISFSQHLLMIKGLKQEGPMTCQRKWEAMKDDGVCFSDSNNNLVYLGFKCFLDYIIY